MSLIIFDFNRTLFNPDPEPGSLNPGAVDTIMELRRTGHIVCIVSREIPKSDRSKKIKELGFDEIVNRVEIVFEADKQPAYSICIKAFQDKTKEIYVIGDYQQYDLIPAKNLNCKTIWFKSGIFSETYAVGFTPDWTITKLNEVIYIVK